MRSYSIVSSDAIQRIGHHYIHWYNCSIMLADCMNMTWHQALHTVSQICSLICLLSILTRRAPNSTPVLSWWRYEASHRHMRSRGIRWYHQIPMVRSCTGWKRLSVNWSNKHDLPTASSIQCRQNTKWLNVRQGHGDWTWIRTRMWRRDQQSRHRHMHHKHQWTTRDAHTRVTNDNVLEEIGVCCARHGGGCCVIVWRRCEGNGGNASSCHKYSTSHDDSHEHTQRQTNRKSRKRGKGNKERRLSAGSVCVCDYMINCNRTRKNRDVMRWWESVCQMQLWWWWWCSHCVRGGSAWSGGNWKPSQQVATWSQQPEQHSIMCQDQ